MQPINTENKLIMFFNLAGCAIAYVMLAISLWLSTEVPLSTKGFWAISVLMLTVSLVNFVKYRFDEKASNDRIRQLEDARNEKILKDYVEES